MTCDECGARTMVLDTREEAPETPARRAVAKRLGSTVLRRRRCCTDCGARFNTYEVQALEVLALLNITED